MEMDFSNTLMETLDMKIEQLKPNSVVMTMPVNEKTHQPFGYLHGGATMALAESAASIGAFLHVDAKKYNFFGMEINANHIKSKRSGLVKAIAKPIHTGKTSMVWSIEIVDEEDTLISIARCTIGIVPKKEKD